MEDNNSPQYSPADFRNRQPARWCAGCGDHAILNTLNKAMAALGVPPHRTAVISGIGCSSRLPYYMDTYGFHTIHGRAAAIATGFKIANPEMTVWQISGDGDGLAIGGNHFIHAVRRNIDINIILFNNKIYGLTKGQYSPTSDRGFVSKSSPYGTVEDPFIPAELVFGARGNRITDREVREERTIHLRHGEKMLFGANNERGLVRDGFLLRAVTVGENGYTLDDILVHDAHTASNFLHQQLAMMDGLGELPLAIGVIRDVEAPVYNRCLDEQVASVRASKGFNSLREMILSGDTWQVGHSE